MGLQVIYRFRIDFNEGYFSCFPREELGEDTHAGGQFQVHCGN